MDTTQIYGILNDIVSQGIGANGITSVNAENLISLGDAVLTSQSSTEAFLNALALRIGRTIIRFRKYNNKLSGLLLDDFEWGAILQKIRVGMPDAETDESFGLTDGASVDHYKVKKPEVEQKLFVTRTPYQYHVTIQRAHLKEAFTSEDAMGRFISAIFGEVRNAIDYGLERLGRTAITNMIAESYGASAAAPKQNVVNLGTLYRTLNANAPATADGLMNDPDFMRFAISTINTRKDMLQEMSVLNMPDANAMPTFTPLDRMHSFILSGFQRRLETVVEYAAFHDEFVKMKDAENLTYLQNAQSPNRIDVLRASDGTNIEVDNIVGIIFDRDACGMYKRMEDTLTTPVNAAGRYYNTYWHLQQLWFNDLQENFVVFTLN